ncbi:hypothetical protein ACFV0W_25125, partial [Streptomyces anulatus]
MRARGRAPAPLDEDERVGPGVAAFGTQPTLGPGQRGGPEQFHAGQQVEQPEVARLDAWREQVGQGVGGNVVQRGAGRLVHGGRAVFPPPDDQRDEREQVVLGQPRRPAQRPLGQHPAGGQFHDGGMPAAALAGAAGGVVLRVGEEIQGRGGGEHVDPAAQIRPQHGARHPRLGPVEQGPRGGGPAVRPLRVQHVQQPGPLGGRPGLVEIVRPHRARRAVGGGGRRPRGGRGAGGGGGRAGWGAGGGARGGAARG